MLTTIYVVDAFTNQPFTGNPAGVCVLPGPAEEQWMQHVAAEMNLSETAFLYPQEDGYSLRWFTPTTEVDLCGHATLSSAHILWERGHCSPEHSIQFHTKSGLLTASRQGNWIELDFPAEKPEEVHAYPEQLIAALDVQPLYVGQNRLDYVIEVESEQTVRELNPNYSVLEQVTARGILVTSRSSGKYDFVSRCFFPAVGIPEDPVTGSAHCGLAPYWQTKLGKDHFSAYQASKRGGELQLEVRGDRVLILGQALTTLKSELLY
ncbi:PhzF family phenazine biosynthesis protein [Ectobacillus ponti]|uniref:PhzF family phenazine biosynthesis protein n=1 Tax=Ectobacillus ponti TaxID=2961894 RepID=A0AA41X9D1_9BACI|nr:PhzF family phenazine biosynthesis protein [Ectobacillus ponti]MCP8971309.1 PhzF family phenazine biosynthesis protein [Ectobacillus ponti]